MILDHNQQLFIVLLKAGLFPVHGEGLKVNDSLFEAVNWEIVYQLAQEQTVQGVVLQGIEWLKSHYLNENKSGFSTNSPQMKLDIPQSLLLQWIGEVQIKERRNKAMNQFVIGLIEKLQGTGDGYLFRNNRSWLKYW